MNPSAGDSRWVVWLSAAAGFAIVGCTWALATARYGGPDEPAHVIRAAAAAHGDLLGEAVARLEPGYRVVTAPAPLASGDPACYRHNEFVTAECATPTRAAGDVEVATSAGVAPPWYYAVVGAIGRAFSSGADVMAYRMATVLVFAIILGAAFMRSREVGGASWLLAAMTPSAWFLLGVVGTSGVEIALIAVALVEAVGRLRDPDTSASLARVSVPLAVCLVMRPAALVDIAVVALVIAPTLRPLSTKRVAALVLPLVMAGAATFGWNHWTGLIFSDRRTADSDSIARALGRSLGGIPLTVHQAIGALGWNEFFAPVPAQLVWIVVLGFAVHWTVTHSNHSSVRRWHAQWIVAALLLPTLLEVIVHDRVGSIWQGRYSISFAMAGVLFAASCKISPERRVMRVVVMCSAFAEVLTLWHTLRRYMVGLDGSFTLQHAAWNPPVNAWVLLAINAAAIAWLASLALSPPTPPSLVAAAVPQRRDSDEVREDHMM
ncbi:MAG: DUF2142 domain-containing protein [Ilumatobacteraceae bacterium]